MFAGLALSAKQKLCVMIGYVEVVYEMPEDFEVIKTSKKVVKTSEAGANPDPAPDIFEVVAINFVLPTYIKFETNTDLKFEMKVQVDKENVLFEGKEIGKVIERRSASDVKVDTDHSIKYTGGYSKDGKTIYLDSRFPKIINVDGKEVNAVDTIAMHHELSEKWLVDEGYTYQYAHIIATKIEREYVESLGVNWDAYSKEVEKHLHEVSGAPLQISPRDLDLAPYTMSNDTATLQEIEKTTEK